MFLPLFAKIKLSRKLPNVQYKNAFFLNPQPIRFCGFFIEKVLLKTHTHARMHTRARVSSLLCYVDVCVLAQNHRVTEHIFSIMASHPPTDVLEPATYTFEIRIPHGATRV